MPLKPTNTGKFYAYEDAGNSKRTAVIFFRLPTGSDKWLFQKCDLVTRQDPLSEEDWDFMGEVAEKIKEKLVELNEPEEE